MREQKGITLIALIITIIVMLILVGVTVNVAINGGLIDVTREAKFKTEVRQIQEALQVKKVTLTATNGGELPETVSITLDNLDMEQELKDNFRNKLTIRKNEDDLILRYTSNATEQEQQWLRELGIEGEEIETPGEEPFVDDFDIAIDKKMFYYSGVGNHIIGVRLEVKSDITNKWGCPEYTVDTALPIVVENMKNKGMIANDDVINTLAQLNVRIYNVMRTEDDDENPLYGAPEANVFYIEDKASVTDVSIQEVINAFVDAGGLPTEYRNPTAEMFYEVINGSSVEEDAARLYHYTPETKTVKIGQSVEELIEIPSSDVNWSDYSVWFDVRANGTYIIELEFDGRKSRETIEVNEIYVEKTEEELLQIAIQESYNTETGKVDLNTLENKLSGKWATYLNSNTNILKFTKNTDGIEYVVTEQGRIEKATLATAEVLEKLEITQSEDKYEGEWEVIGAEGENLKYVSKENVTQVGGTNGTGSAIEARQRYKECENVLNTAAEEATGIAGAKSITMQDIYNILGVQNINIGEPKLYRFRYDETEEAVFREEYSEPFWVYSTNTGEKTIYVIGENGEFEKVGAQSGLKEKNIDALIDYNYKFTEEQIEKLLSLNSTDSSYWIPTRIVIAAKNSSRIDYCLPCVENGEIKNGYWATYNFSIGSEPKGVRAVISL